MIDNKKLGLIYGSLGAILGGILWITLLGIVLKSFFIISLSLLLAALSFATVLFFSKKYPNNDLSTFGILTLWLTSINLIFINTLYEEIPKNIGTLSTGKESLTLGEINFFLGVLFLTGLFLTFKGFINNVALNKKH